MPRSAIMRTLGSLSLVIPLIGITQVATGHAAGIPRVRPTGLIPGALTQADADRLAQHVNQKVIVIMNDQQTSLSGRFQSEARAAAFRADQAPVLAELSQVQATKVTPFHIINAIAATVSQGERDRLSANPAVKAVVADRQIKGPSPVGPTPESGQAESTGANPGITPGVSSGVTSGVIPGVVDTGGEIVPPPGPLPPSEIPQTGSPCTTTPQLEPEALQLTHTAFNNPAIPQAQNIVDGTGVRVAYIAEGIDITNPDFTRADGSSVFADYQDFSGEGTNAVTGGGEAFLDASSIAAQGRVTYDVNSYVNPAHLAKNAPPCLIKIRGVAPGASLVGLKVFGVNNIAFNSAFVQAIQYAVDHGVNVLNESFGGTYFPDNANDPVALADEQAIVQGVTITVSTGDAGTASTIGSPASVPDVIRVGASTQFRGYAQTTSYGFQLSNGHWVSDNISSLSSGGITQNGPQTVDVVAPGDLGWAVCTASPMYTDCTDYHGGRSNFVLSGGTSEAAPLTAGEAALVIQAYRQTHNNANPSPHLVKQLITGTADDLEIPSQEQGSGIIDSLRAVQAAQSYHDQYGSPPIVGNNLITSPTSLSATAAPNTTQSFPVQVTNVTNTPEVVSAQLRTLGRTLSSANRDVALNHLPTTPTFIDQVGRKRIYTTQTFTVPAGAQRLDASIAWDVVNQPGSLVRLTLLDPQGNYAAFSLPQDSLAISSGFGHVDVRYPMAGTWTAIIWTSASSAGYNGIVHLSEASSVFTTVPILFTALHLAPGQTGTTTITLRTPYQPGDKNYDLILTGHSTVGGTVSATTLLPVVLRSLITIGSQANAPLGTFSGVLTGGNGRGGGPGQSVTYQFDVPRGERDLELNIHLADSGYNLAGFLIGPDGLPRDVQTTVTGLDPLSFYPTGYTNTMQFFRRDPEAGRWTFVLDVDNNISGAQTSIPFTGTVAFNQVKVTQSSLPQSVATQLTAGQPITVPIQVTNTGNTTKQFFADPRLSHQSEHVFCCYQQTLPLTIAQYQTQPQNWVVPSETSQVNFVAETNPTSPFTMEASYGAGSSPSGFTGSPDLLGAPFIDVFTGNYANSVSLTTPEVPMGFWSTGEMEQGPFGANPAPSVPIVVSSTMVYQDFDTTIVPSTGDGWAYFLGNPGATYTPLILAPGQTGTINVTITPSGSVGSVVHGAIYIDTLNIQEFGGPGNFAELNNASGDELIAIPYTYTIK